MYQIQLHPPNLEHWYIFQVHHEVVLLLSEHSKVHPSLIGEDEPPAVPNILSGTFLGPRNERFLDWSYFSVPMPSSNPYPLSYSLGEVESSHRVSPKGHHFVSCPVSPEINNLSSSPEFSPSVVVQRGLRPLHKHPHPVSSLSQVGVQTSSEGISQNRLDIPVAFHFVPSSPVSPIWLVEVHRMEQVLPSW